MELDYALLHGVSDIAELLRGLGCRTPTMSGREIERDKDVMI